MKNAMVYWLLITGILFMCFGCNVVKKRHAQMIQAGYSKAYADGYAQGTPSGEYAAGNPYARFKKNPYRYQRDNQYQQGWDDGYRVAYGQYSSFNR